MSLKQAWYGLLCAIAAVPGTLRDLKDRGFDATHMKAAHAYVANQHVIALLIRTSGAKHTSRPGINGGCVRMPTRGDGVNGGDGVSGGLPPVRGGRPVQQKELQGLG